MALILEYKIIEIRYDLLRSYNDRLLTYLIREIRIILLMGNLVLIC